MIQLSTLGRPNQENLEGCQLIQTNLKTVCLSPPLSRGDEVRSPGYPGRGRGESAAGHAALLPADEGAHDYRALPHS